MKQQDKKTTITFHGGTGVVTGANFLLETKTGLNILVDCGLQQGREAKDSNYNDFDYDPSKMDVLFVTHAHLDHIGRVPKLAKDGFNGIIYSTPSTKEIATIMFEDTVRLLAEDAKKRGRDPIYDITDVEKALSLWKTVPYYAETDIRDGYNFTFKDAGHILGSIMVEIKHEGKKMVFTGDLGNSPTPFLRDVDKITDADYVLMESVYGDRNHETVPKERSEKLLGYIKDTIEKRGTLIIPAFSIERTQIILYEIHKFIENGLMPKIPVYLDSPLAIKVTEIYRKRHKNFKDSIQKEISREDDIFDFPGLIETLRTDESRRIKKSENPKIIIAGSGMSHGGRIMSHEKLYLPDPKSTLLFVGYQVAGNLGRQVQDGAKKVRIDDTMVSIKARVESISGFSAHKDSDGLVDFIENTSDKVKKVFVAMGEPKASLFLTQKLRDNLDVDAIAPKKGDSFEIDL